MSQMTEKCDPKILEENLIKLKECDEYIHKSYKDVKKKYHEIIKTDLNTDECKKSFSEILELLQAICKKTFNKVRDLEVNVSKDILFQLTKENPEKETPIEKEKPVEKENPVEKEKLVEKETSKSCENKSSSKGSEDKGAEPSHDEKEMVSIPFTVVNEHNKKQSTTEPVVNDSENVEQNGLPVTEVASELLESSINNTNLIEIEQEENLGKENEKPKENVEGIKDIIHPKGVIRLVSIEKLLDPSIASFHKKPKRVSTGFNFSNSVIVLDSDEDDQPAPLPPIISSQNKTSLEEGVQKANDSKNKSEETRSLSKVASKNVQVQDVNRNKTDNKKTDKSNPKLRKLTVKIKSIKLLNKMLKENKFKIRSTEDLSKQFDWVTPNELPNSLTSEPDSKKDKSRESIKIKFRKLKKKISFVKGSSSSSSSDSEEDDYMEGRSKLNCTTSRKQKVKRAIRQKGNRNMGDSSRSNLNELPNKIDDSSSSGLGDETVTKLMEKIIQKEKGKHDDNTASTEKKSSKCQSLIKNSSRNILLSSSSDEENGNNSGTKQKEKKDTVNKDNQKSIKSEGKSAANENDKNNSSSSSSSEGTVIRKKKRQKTPSSATSSDNSDKNDDDDDSDDGKKKKTKKRKRIRNADDSESSSNEKENPNKKRKNIRKLLKTKDLVRDTKKATKEEEERKKRIEERQKLYNKIYEKPENVELKELVLDFNEETKEPLLSVDSGILKKLKPHQAAGIKFMWDACFETLKDARKKPGSGCILAHCMGLGKTLQVVTLTHTLIMHSDKTHIERVLIIAPLSTLTNWAKEYITWMKFCKKRDVEIYDMSKWRERNLRVHKVNEWFEEGGVCILGYDMYRILTNTKSATLKKKQRESLQKCLVDPGPDLVVCDEGHLLKNEKTSLSQAVNKLRTQRRIVLTGTPLQNNLKEYYCMIQFIKPNLLGTYKEYLNRFVNPITNGQYTDSTTRDIQLMKNRSHVLHKLLEGCIQRRDYSVLAPYLPPKHEYVVFITLTEMQRKLYEFYMTKQRDIITEMKYAGKGAMLFQDFQNLRRIWTHPMCLRVNSDVVRRKKFLQDYSDSEGSLKDFIDDSGESKSNSSDTSSSDSSDEKNDEFDINKTKLGTRRTRGNPGAGNDNNIAMEVDGIEEDDPSEWWKPLCPEEELNNINHSPKLILLMELLESCENIGDKILLFSQSLQSLDVIEHFLSLIDKKTQGDEVEGDLGNFKGSWQPGIDYFRLDGSSTVENREIMCRNFNNVNNLRGRLFLISTRAGSLGINLVAANRVIIFDVSWNPSHDTQSIFRVYRFGQEKPCYIYRFISLGTMEQKVYERQVAKQATAKRVVDEQQIGRHYNQSDLLELYRYELNSPEVREVPALPKDRLFADLLAKHDKLINKYHEHDSLLENEESENLNEEERKAAWAEYQAEKERPAQQFNTYNRMTYANVNGPVTSNKHLGFRTDILLRLLNIMVRQDHPTLNDIEISSMVPVYLQRLEAQINNNDVSMYRKLLDLHTQLGATHGYYIDPTGGYMSNAMMAGINPMALMSQAQGQFMAQPPPNSSQVYEVE